MSKSSSKQQLTFVTTLACNANLDQFTTEQLQMGIAEPERAGHEFALFVRYGCRVSIGDFFRETGELTLQIPALPHQTLEELQKKFSRVKAIERDTSPTEAVALALGTVFRADETSSIIGAEYERRTTPKLDAVLGYQQAIWLVEHQDESSEFQALLGKVYIDFLGLVVVFADGSRNFPCLSGGGGRWKLSWRRLSDEFGPSGRIAVSSKPR